MPTESPLHLLSWKSYSFNIIFSTPFISSTIIPTFCKCYWANYFCWFKNFSGSNLEVANPTCQQEECWAGWTMSSSSWVYKEEDDPGINAAIKAGESREGDTERQDFLGEDAQAGPSLGLCQGRKTWAANEEWLGAQYGQLVVLKSLRTEDTLEKTHHSRSH